MRVSEVFSRALTTFLALSLTTKGVLSFVQPVKYVLFILNNMSYMKVWNKSGPRTELCGNSDRIVSHEL